MLIQQSTVSNGCHPCERTQQTHERSALKSPTIALYLPQAKDRLYLTAPTHSHGNLFLLMSGSNFTRLDRRKYCCLHYPLRHFPLESVLAGIFRAEHKRVALSRMAALVRPRSLLSIQTGFCTKCLLSKARRGRW